MTSLSDAVAHLGIDRAFSGIANAQLSSDAQEKMAVNGCASALVATLVAAMVAVR
jgi:hypothetical protein